MQEININNHPTNSDDEINLRELFNVLFKGKWIIISITAFVSIIVLIYSLSLPNIYQSKALLVPVKSSSSLSGAMKNYSGLANLAGLNIPSQDGDGNSVKAIEKLKSFSFFENFMLPNIYLPNLMAVQSWNHKTGILIYDEDIYDETSNAWLREASYPKKIIPSAQESFLIFKSQHLSLSEDKKTGFISVAISHQSPYVAKKWVEILIEEINTFYRQKDKLEAQKAVAYLNKQIAKTNLSEIKQIMAELVQQETQKLTLIEANESYVFEYIDPPVVMERKSEPSRAIICILGALLGGMFSILIVLIRYYAFKKKDF